MTTRQNAPARWALALLGAALLAGCGQEASNSAPAEAAASASKLSADAIRAKVATVDEAAIIAADPNNWLAHGRTYDEQRHSPLAQINADNVGELGLAWYWDTGTTRGLESTPIVVDGVMFNTGSWSTVFAHDARTGELLWKYDPESPGVGRLRLL